MRKNVFLRSTLRQPVKTAMLVIVTALITFAFVARASEYLLVRQETERLGEYYRAIGTLETDALEPDTAALLEYLEENPYVETVNYEHTASAVMEGVYNGDIDNYCSYVYLNGDVFFYGTLVKVTEFMPGAYKFYFMPDKYVAGYPHFCAEDRMITMVSPQSALVNGDIYHNTIYYTDLLDLTDVSREMQPGSRYLLRGRYVFNDQICSLTEQEACFEFIPLVKDGPWFYPVEEGKEADLSDPQLAGLEEDIRLVDDNQHALNICALKDMSAWPWAQESQQNMYLVDGRWLDAQDDAEGAKVCVINSGFAMTRGLEVGDTITMSLRNVKGGYTGTGYLWTEEELASRDSIEKTGPEAYRIVGIYSYVTGNWRTFSGNNTFIPASALPDTLFHEDDPLYLGCASFTLTSPAVKDRFEAEAVDELAALGVRTVFCENGWDHFQAAAQPMRRSSAYNALIYSAVLTAALCLIVLIYFRIRRKELAIARSLGVPVRQCVYEVSVPLLLTCLTGVLCGGGAGWRYALGNAAETLRSLNEFGEITERLSILWLAVLCGIPLVLLLDLTWISASLLAGKPVLTLLQGGSSQPKYSKALPEPEAAPLQAAPVEHPTAVWNTAPAGTSALGAAHVLRFFWRHIVRSKTKSALTVLLAAVFTVSLSVIYSSIIDNESKLDALYKTVSVEVDLLQADMNKTVKGGGIVQESTLQSILESGFVSDCYLEGASAATAGEYGGSWRRGQNILFRDGTAKTTTIRSFEDAAAFQENSGAGIEITYLDGWDASLFAEDWGKIDAQCPDTSPALFPVILPLSMYEGLGDGGTLGVACGTARLCTAAGYYTGAVEGNIMETEPILMPTSALRVMRGENMTYSRVHFCLDAAKNREIESFRAAMNSVIEDPDTGPVPLRTVIWDEELRTAVAPLENSVELMRVPYPVTLVLSLLVAAGIAVLFVMTSAKEAAIMRVLGTSRLRSRVMLALQTAFTSAAGLVAGLLGVLAYTGRTRPDLFADLIGASVLCALLYLLAAILGAAASASAVTSKNPLELLQVKE